MFENNDTNHKLLRKDFESALKNAKVVDEETAHAVRAQLGVGSSVLHEHLDEDKRQFHLQLQINGQKVVGKKNTLQRMQEIESLIKKKKASKSEVSE